VYYKIFRAVFLNTVFMILIAYLIETISFSRIWIVLMLLLNIIFIALSRYMLKKTASYMVRFLGLQSNTLVIADGEEYKRIKKTLESYKTESYSIIGLKGRAPDTGGIAGAPGIEGLIRKYDIKKIVITGKFLTSPEIVKILYGPGCNDILVFLFPGFFELSTSRMLIRDIGGVPLIQLTSSSYGGVKILYKSLLDYILSLLSIIILSPVFLVIAIMIKTGSPGPVFYRQLRVTRGFKRFYMYKFRTMIKDADQMIAGLKDSNESGGPTFKIKCDPRVTRVGRFLRRLSLDELPQLINVIKGDMSIVGPRPPIPGEIAGYEEWHKRRLAVKQGITGLWQVSGRSDLVFEEMVRFDLYYIQNWSLAMDIKIILKTIPAVLTGRGAY
jgi:exopolysaccharide biosynthesis polyprenyl glycosylphosphotransferase